MAGTFVSYRRDDSAGWTGRLYEYLVREWGADEVFMDIDAIAPGEDFRKAIATTMNVSDTVLVVIGPSWLDARDEAGRRRLDNERDTHRTEVAAALEADVRVIPVLVGGAAMPVAPELPEPLQELAYRNAAVIDDRRFPADVRGLINAVSQAREAATIWAAPDSGSANAPGSSKPRRFLNRSQPSPTRPSGTATRPHATPTYGAPRQPRAGGAPPSRESFFSRPPAWVAVAGIAIVLIWGALVTRTWHSEDSGIRIIAALVLVGVSTWGISSKKWNLVLAGGVAGLVGVILWVLQLFANEHTTSDLFSPGTDGVPNLLMLAGCVMVVGAAFAGKASDRVVDVRDR
jgi:hypothetical protein